MGLSGLSWVLSVDLCWRLTFLGLGGLFTLLCVVFHGSMVD